MDREPLGKPILGVQILGSLQKMVAFSLISSRDHLFSHAPPFSFLPHKLCEYIEQAILETSCS